MVPLEVEQWLGRSATLRTLTVKKVEDAVRNYCSREGFAYLSRVKGRDSVAEKLETGRVRGLRSFDDLLGCSIIIPSLNHEGAVLAELRRMFDEVSLLARHHSDKYPDVFRFEATRFIGRLRVPAEGSEHLAEMLFEIQVRTAFEHAWSVATHLPAYKADGIDWKLERLSAQMKALVEQLDMLAVAYEASAQEIVAHPCRKTDSELAIFNGFKAIENLIPEECTPAKWGLFSKNIISLLEAADWGRRIELTERIALTLQIVGRQLADDDLTRFPRSISLYQYVLGVLVQGEHVRPQMRRPDYFPVVTAALEGLFPKTRDITPRCDLS